MLKLEKPVLGNTHILYLSKDEHYNGFIHNKIYKHGFYKEVRSKCKCCKQLTRIHMHWHMRASFPTLAEHVGFHLPEALGHAAG